MRSIKEINIENRTYYFFDDMINIKGFDSNLLKIAKSPYKKVDVYYIGYITMKDSDYLKINSVNPLYLIIDQMDTLKKKMKINIQLWFLQIKKKEILIRCTQRWDKNKNLIKK